MHSDFASAIYHGTVRHRRFSPKKHEFIYHVFMMYIDINELDRIFKLTPFLSDKKWAPARYKRSDFHIGNMKSNAVDNGENSLPSIDCAVRDTVESETGFRPKGSIRMLVNLRYWGFSINPISTYYCFDESNTNIIAILAEVHNTPWNERHSYVLAGKDFDKKQECIFPKKFHVSPFNPLDMVYQWKSTTPAKTLSVHLENWQTNEKLMDATISLTHLPMNKKNIHAVLIHYPWMTVKVITAIYWQALRLWLKGMPTFNHPRTGN